MLNGKDMLIHLVLGLISQMHYTQCHEKLSQCFPKSYNLYRDIKVEVEIT